MFPLGTVIPLQQFLLPADSFTVKFKIWVSWNRLYSVWYQKVYNLHIHQVGESWQVLISLTTGHQSSNILAAGPSKKSGNGMSYFRTWKNCKSRWTNDQLTNYMTNFWKKLVFWQAFSSRFLSTCTLRTILPVRRSTSEGIHGSIRFTTINGTILAHFFLLLLHQLLDELFVHSCKIILTCFLCHRELKFGTHNWVTLFSVLWIKTTVSSARNICWKLSSFGRLTSVRMLSDFACCPRSNVFFFFLKDWRCHLDHDRTKI